MAHGVKAENTFKIAAVAEAVHVYSFGAKSWDVWTLAAVTTTAQSLAAGFYPSSGPQRLERRGHCLWILDRRTNLNKDRPILSASKM